MKPNEILDPIDNVVVSFRLCLSMENWISLRNGVLATAPLILSSLYECPEWNHAAAAESERIIHIFLCTSSGVTDGKRQMNVKPTWFILDAIIVSCDTELKFIYLDTVKFTLTDLCFSFSQNEWKTLLIMGQ